MPLPPTKPAADAVFTMVPPPWCSIWGISYFMQSQTPVRFTAITCCHRSSGYSAVRGALGDSYTHGEPPYNPTATLLEHALLTQGFMGTSKAAFPSRLRPQSPDSTWENLVSTRK